MITAREMRRVSEEACTDEEYDAARDWLLEKMTQEAERGNTMLVHRVDMRSPTPNFNMCLTRLEGELESDGYKFETYRNDIGRPSRIVIAW